MNPNMKLPFVLAVGIVSPIQVEIADYLRRQQQAAIESHKKEMFQMDLPVTLNQITIKSIL